MNDPQRDGSCLFRGLIDIIKENSTQTLTSGYFVGGQRDRYICLWQNINLDDSMIDFSLHKKSGYDFEYIDQENVEQSDRINIEQNVTEQTLIIMTEKTLNINGGEEVKQSGG